MRKKGTTAKVQKKLESKRDSSTLMSRSIGKRAVDVEFSVPTNTTNSQDSPSVAALTNGNFVVAWNSNHQNLSYTDVYAQIFDANANKVGSQFLVNTLYNDHNQAYPCVTAQPNGNFVITYDSVNQDGSSWGVYNEFFSPAASWLGGGSTPINTNTTNSQSDSSATSFSTTSNIAVTWTSYGQDSDSSPGVYAQILDAFGSKFGGEFRVNTYTTSEQNSPSITTLTNNNFVVAWQSFAQDSSANGVYAQIFNSSGVKVGSEFRVNTYITFSQEAPAIAALTNGNFVVVWQSYLQISSSGYDIYGQIFTSTGSQVGTEFLVNTYTTNDQTIPAIASLANGKFAVVWQSNLQDGSSYGIYGQVFTSSASKIGNEFRINTYVINEQQNPSIATLSNGNLVVTWGSFQDCSCTSGYGIYGKVIKTSLSATNTNQAITYTEDTNFNLADIVITTPVYITNVTASLTLVNPLIGSFTTGTSGSVTSTYNITSGEWRASGLLANVNTLLAGLQFAPQPNVNGNTTINLAISDDGNSSVNDAITVTGIAVNDAPVNTVPPAQVTVEDTALIFSTANGNAISIADVDAGSNNVQVTLTATNGTLTLGALSGLSFAFGDGSADTTMAFTGTISNINTALQGLRYDPASAYSGAASIQIETKDLGNVGNGGGITDTDTVNITVTNVDSTPTLINNTLTISEGQTVTITNANLSATDPDTSAGSLVFTISNLQHGQFQLASNPSVAITSFTQQQIIDGEVQFAHDGSETAPTYQATVSDGILSSASATAGVIYTAINDAPVVVNPIPDQSAVEKESFSFVVESDVFNDPEGEALTMSATQEDGSALPSWVTFSPQEMKFSGKAPSSVGASRFSLFARDPGSLEARADFSFNVLEGKSADPLSKVETLVSIIGGGIGAIAAISGGIYGIYRWKKNQREEQAANKNVEMDMRQQTENNSSAPKNSVV